jgi:hypothetical protein
LRRKQPFPGDSRTIVRRGHGGLIVGATANRVPNNSTLTPEIAGSPASDAVSVPVLERGPGHGLRAGGPTANTRNAAQALILKDSPKRDDFIRCNPDGTTPYHGWDTLPYCFEEPHAVRLHERIVLITGASSTGAACARAFAGEEPAYPLARRRDAMTAAHPGPARARCEGRSGRALDVRDPVAAGAIDGLPPRGATSTSW